MPHGRSRGLAGAALAGALGVLAASCASRDPEPVALHPPADATADPIGDARGPTPVGTERGPMSIASGASSHETEPPVAPTARPEVWTRCSSNPDCVLSRVDPETCCATCDTTALTRAQQEELTERCAKRTPEGCPERVCERGPNTAVCEDHTCTARRISPPRS